MIARSNVRGPLTLAAIILAFFLGKACHTCDPCPGSGVVIPGNNDTTTTITTEKDSTTGPLKPKSTKHGVKLVKKGGDSLCHVPETYDPVADSGYYPCPIDTNEYEQSYCDSDVTVFSTTAGELIKQKVEFRRKTIEIHRTDTIIRPSKWDVAIGGAVIGNQMSSGAAGVLIVSHKNNRYFSGYDPIRKEGLLGVGISLWHSKK